MTARRSVSRGRPTVISEDAHLWRARDGSGALSWYELPSSAAAAKTLRVVLASPLVEEGSGPDG